MKTALSRHRPFRTVASLVVVVLCVVSAAAVVPIAKPEEVGFSSERLQRVNQVVQRAIDAKQIAGAVTVVSRRGKVAHFEAQGWMDMETKTPMRKDAIFRMASMSKPVTGVAIMILLEEGKVRLNDPVSRFIPEFKETKVAVEKPAPAPPPGAPPAAPGGRGRGRGPAPEITLVDATRPITVRDLLTHTSGLESGGAGSREGNRIAPRDTTSNLAAYVPKLGGVPLDFQPGTAWRYSSLAGMEVLGRIVEVASGMTFDQFLKQRIFDPLGMKDTAFFEPDEKLPRVASLYDRDRTTQVLTKGPTPSWLDTKTFFSGGGGLWSTGEDYLQFAQMLVNGGQLNGKRILGPRTVDLMSANQLGDLYAKGNRPGMGWGLSVEVVDDPILANRRTSSGSFGWDGAFGTHFWVDRKEQITGILLIQQGVQSQLNRDFENAVMQAVVD